MKRLPDHEKYNRNAIHNSPVSLDDICTLSDPMLIRLYLGRLESLTQDFNQSKLPNIIHCLAIRIRRKLGNMIPDTKENALLTAILKASDTRDFTAFHLQSKMFQCNPIYDTNLSGSFHYHDTVDTIEWMFAAPYHSSLTSMLVNKPLYLKFDVNLVQMRSFFDHYLDEVLPHEAAHATAYIYHQLLPTILEQYDVVLPDMEKHDMSTDAHDNIWKSYAFLFGASGSIKNETHFITARTTDILEAFYHDNPKCRISPKAHNPITPHNRMYPYICKNGHIHGLNHAMHKEHRSGVPFTCNECSALITYDIEQYSGNTPLSTCY